MARVRIAMWGYAVTLGRAEQKDRHCYIPENNIEQSLPYQSWSSYQHIYVLEM